MRFRREVVTLNHLISVFLQTKQIKQQLMSVFSDIFEFEFKLCSLELINSQLNFKRETINQ